MSGGMEDSAHEEREVRALVVATIHMADALRDVHDAAFGSRVGRALLDELNERLRGTGFKLARTITEPSPDHELKPR